MSDIERKEVKKEDVCVHLSFLAWQARALISLQSSYQITDAWEHVQTGSKLYSYLAG